MRLVLNADSRQMKTSLGQRSETLFNGDRHIRISSVLWPRFRPAVVRVVQACPEFPDFDCLEIPFISIKLPTFLPVAL